MEEEVGVKATRSRRNLSVEVEDTKSPSTQSTPTKKRGGRLATKPQLELIHEDVPATAEEPQKRTRKSLARVIEPEEKVVTPSRRSTRIRSNVSNVSETPTETEDKGTPSRRSTRIRSNTSINAEATQFENSPRAQRAASRRISLAGSDNETAVTPVRQTRRTRKNSTTSVDKQVESNVSRLEEQPKLVIVEEADKDQNENKNDTIKDEKNSPNIRRSPRLVEKIGKRGSSQEDNENEQQIVKTDEKLNSESKIDHMAEESSTIDKEQNTVAKVNNLSVSSSNLIKDLETKPKKSCNRLNYTTSELEKSSLKSKRHRTKSWTTITSSSSSDPHFLSDTEIIKQKSDTNNTTHDLSITSGSGDGISISSKKKTDEKFFLRSTKGNKDNTEALLNVSTSKEFKNSNDVSIIGTTNSDVTIENTSVHLDKSTSKIENIDSTKYDRIVLASTPKCQVKSTVYIEDSDSNVVDKNNSNYEINAEDQCVPVIKHQMEDTVLKDNLSYEPMDIDETITENVSLTAFTVNNPGEETGNKSILHNASEANTCNEFQSKARNLNDENDMRLNNSKGTSYIDLTCDDNRSAIKSKKKTSNAIFEEVVTEDNTDEIKNRSTSITVTTSEDTSEICMNQEANQGISIIANKSNRKSSISNTSTDVNIVNKSKRMSSNSNINSSHVIITDYFDNRRQESTAENIDAIDLNVDSLNKSKRNSLSIASGDDGPSHKETKVLNKIKLSNTFDKSKSQTNNDVVSQNSNKSKRASSSSINNDTLNKTSTVNKNESDMTDVKNTSEIKHKSSRKEKENYMLSSKDNDSIDESANKSSKKLSISHMDSQSVDKSNIENKSTLVLSQIKDTSEANIESNEGLSKSLNIPNVKTDIDKKNLSLAYSTSTPLQEKSIKKIGMQFNTSNINKSSSATTNNKYDVLTKVNKEPVNLQNESQSSDETDSDTDEEETENKSIFIDDEAEEASEDYESGDSRDEDEREFEEENEIVENGETLDSEEEDFSDDSEYEKDSFVVDSDEEDNDLLSGSGDDLSMSADELNMSSKSKNKFNARKIKEQKKASKEMFNARHKINESNSSIKSDKPKQNNRQRLESSDSDSDKDEFQQLKRSKRARIDSSQDISMTRSDTDNSVTIKKKKMRPLSDSVCDDNVIIEKEIAIGQSNETASNKDPLSLQSSVKKEPNMSQINLNISTVAITEGADIEKVEVDEDVSLMKMTSNMSSDPLQNTVAHDSATESDDDSISENEEISKNYDYVLNNLNKMKSKTTDISLNLDKKVKKKPKEPIVDELNLTQTKSKKTKNSLTTDSECKQINKSEDTHKIAANNMNTDEDTSSSIDMKLLFNDDSTDSENKMMPLEVPERIIPLKRTEGKTNILGSADGEILSFFIDTTGTHTNKNDSAKYIDDNSVKTSAKKKKQRNTSFNKTEEDENSSDAPLEISYQSEKKNDLSIHDIHTTQSDDTPNTSVKSGKKNKKALNTSQTVVDELSIEGEKVNLSTPGSNKKKKKKNSLSINEQELAEPVLAEHIDHATVNSAKKQKQRTSSKNLELENELEAEQHNISTTGSKKKKLSLSLDEQATEQHNISTTGSNKKKKKLSLSLDEQETAAPVLEEVIDNVTVSSVKKQKQRTSSKNLDTKNELEEQHNINTSGSNKKKKKLSLSLDEQETAAPVLEEVIDNVTVSSVKKQKQRTPSKNFETENELEAEIVNISTTGRNKKKKKLSLSLDEQGTDNELVVNQVVPSKKSKRKRSEQLLVQEEDSQSLNNLKSQNVSMVANEKKKRKVSSGLGDANFSEEVQEDDSLTRRAGKKHKKKNHSSDNDQLAADAIKKDKKKRKMDDNDKVSKAEKQNEKGLVPRLPTKVIKQLVDKPINENNISKSSFVSTTSFKVEKPKKKKIKPSNYLEQSVYLNDSMEEAPKKSSLLQPKVWPSVPSVSLSNQGFTTNFKVDVIMPQNSNFVFVGQSNDAPNFKKDYLHKNRIKKLGTFEMYKRHRNVKLSKF